MLSIEECMEESKRKEVSNLNRKMNRVEDSML